MFRFACILIAALAMAPPADANGRNFVVRQVVCPPAAIFSAPVVVQHVVPVVQQQVYAAPVFAAPVYSAPVCSSAAFSSFGYGGAAFAPSFGYGGFRSFGGFHDVGFRQRFFSPRPGFGVGLSIGGGGGVRLGVGRGLFGF